MNRLTATQTTTTATDIHDSKLKTENSKLRTPTSDRLFMDAAARAIEYIAGRYSEFTTDDIEPICILSPKEPRAWGVAMQHAARAGLIERTERTRQSKSRVCHGREKRIWRSKVLGQAASAQGASGHTANLFGNELAPTSYGLI